MLGLAIVTIAVGVGVGYAWGGPDRGVSARTAALTAVVVASMIFVNQVMRVWPAYYNAPAISGRPIPTIGNSTPNLGGNFWVQTLDTFTHLLLPTLALLLIGFAAYTRYSRSSMLEVMNQDYIRTARSKGLPGAHGDHAARVPQLADPAGDRRADRRHHAARWRHHHREGVRPAGHGHALPLLAARTPRSTRSWRTC